MHLPPLPRRCGFVAPIGLRALALGVAAALSAVHPLQAQGLAADLARLMDAAPFNRSHWGLVVLDPTGRVVASRHAEQFFMPASNTKLLATAAAAVVLPPGFTVRTSVYAGGPVANGTVMGDLILYGRGDPTLSQRCYAGDTLQAGVCQRDAEEPLRRLARRLRAAGVMSVAGDLIGDGSWFEPTVVHPTWEGYDLNWWYAAPVSGLGVYDNALSVTHAAGIALGAPAAITIAPEVEGVVLENRTRTVADGEPQTLDFTRVPGTLRIVAEGTVRQSTRAATEYFALPDPNYFTAAVFRRVLAEEGISVAGATRSTTDSLETIAWRQAAPIAELESRPVEDWLFPVLNSSQNWFAEMLLKQLGRQVGGEGSWRMGNEVVRRFLIDSVRVDSTQFHAVDGSGLSSQNLVTPIAFARLLQWMRGHPRFPVFAAALPQSGERGSLRTRFVGTALAGRVRAKTGSITGVNSLSGYIDRPGERPLVFSIMVNHHALPSSVVIRQIDSLVVRIGKGG